MSKLSRLNVAVVVTAGILISSVTRTDYSYSTPSKTQGLDSSSSSQGISRGTGESKGGSGSVREQVEQEIDSIQNEIEERGIKDQLSEKELNAFEGIKHWKAQEKNANEALDIIGKQEKKAADKEAKKNQDVQNQIASANAGGARQAKPNTQALEGLEDCNVNTSGLKDTAGQMNSAPVQEFLKGVQGIFEAKTKKDKKARKAKNAATFAALEKKFQTPQDKEFKQMEEQIENKVKTGEISVPESEKLLKDLESKRDKTKESSDQAFLALMRKIHEMAQEREDDEDKAKEKRQLADKAKKFDADLQALREQMKQEALNIAKAARKCCIDKRDEAGYTGDSSGGVIQSMAQQDPSQGGLGVLNPFPGGSKARAAIDFMTAEYRGSTNGVPVVSSYVSQISGMVNDLKCTDMSSQIETALGGNLQNQMSVVSRITKPEDINTSISGAMNALNGAVSQLNFDQSAAQFKKAKEVGEQIQEFTQGSAARMQQQPQPPGRGQFAQGQQFGPAGHVTQ